MTKRRQALGRAGEERAARFLAARGYQIVARNVRAERVEIDLIARSGRVLCFVEVKTRQQALGVTRANAPETGHGEAAESVDSRKQARLRRGAAAWLAAHPQIARHAGRVRFDVITCLRRQDARWSIDHWRAAF